MIDTSIGGRAMAGQGFARVRKRLDILLISRCLPSLQFSQHESVFRGSHNSMSTLSFSLKPSALLQLHDTFVCLNKFSENVSIEAEYDLVNKLNYRIYAWNFLANELQSSV